MARHDITAQVRRIFDLGGTEEQVYAAGSKVDGFNDGTWYAGNRATCAGIDRLEAALKTTFERKAASEAIISKIREGRILYTKTAAGWMVWGRDDVIVEGSTVIAERRNGSAERIVLVTVGPVRERDGLRYRTAEFRPATSVTEVDPMDEVQGITGEAATEAAINRFYGADDGF